MADRDGPSLIDELTRCLMRIEDRPQPGDALHAAGLVVALRQLPELAASCGCVQLLTAAEAVLRALPEGVASAECASQLIEAASLLAGALAEPGVVEVQAASLADRLALPAACAPREAEPSWPGPGRDIDPELLAGFISENSEHIQDAEAALLALEQEPGDADALHRLFRAVHSVKGTADYVGLAQIKTLGHRLESALDRVRQGRLALERRTADLLFAGVDELKSMIAALSPAGEQDRDLHGLVADLDALCQDGTVLHPPTADTEPSAEEVFARTARQHLEGITAALGAIAGGDVADATLAMLRRSAGSLRSASNFVQRDDVVQVAAHVLEAAEKFQNVQARLRGLLEGLSEFRTPTPVASAPPVHPAAEPAAPREVKQAAPASKSLRVDQHKLDEYVNLAGELVIARNALGHDFRLVQSGKGNLRRLKDSVDKIDRVVADIQNNAMSMRMVPVGTVFQRFQRLVRDLARSLGKDIELEISGEETELDKQVVEALADPLLHLIRNAADHGIERPEEREAAGKPATGRIHLRAGREGNLILIDIEDDGAGIDEGRLREKAVAAGLLSSEQAAELAREAALELIFAPGLSTAREVSDISGRGVGMDVVRSNITRLGGRVHIDSHPGRGTHIRLQLPLTLAVTSVVIVAAGAALYGLPIDTIRETVKVAPTEVRHLRGQPAIVLRGEVVVLRSLAGLLDGTDAGALALDPSGHLRVVVVRAAGGAIGLMVHELRGQQEIVLKPLPPGLGRASGLAGAAILGDGSVVLILDPAALVEG